VEDDVLKVFIMSEQLRVSFEDDGIAQIQMINGENRFQTPTVKEWNAALDKIVAWVDLDLHMTKITQVNLCVQCYVRLIGGTL